tara:strand:- start:8727 stop:9815 length:1089 start_codon:yes stop_codon:yes gene_type:complete
VKTLYVITSETSIYSEELNKVRTIIPKSTVKLEELSIEFLKQNNFEVVVSTELPEHWQYVLNGMKTVSIIFGNNTQSKLRADIIIDSQNENEKFYFSGEKASVLNNSNFPIDEVINLVKPLPWDSDFFGHNIALISSRYLTPNIMKSVNCFVDKNKVDMLEYLCNCHDRESVRTAENSNFHFTDIRITFRKQLVRANLDEIKLNDYRFAKASKKDIPKLKSMTQKMYEDSRYFFDENFDRSRLNQFYESWVEKGVYGTFDDECLGLFHKEEIIGFVTLKYNQNNSVSLRLIGVDSTYQGKGIGKRLLQSVESHIEKKGFKQINVVTQGRNYHAQRLYQSMGYKTQSTELWFHKWMKASSLES